MDQNLVNFWKNYEDIINWSYMISGVRETDMHDLTVSNNIQSRVCIYCSFSSDYIIFELSVVVVLFV